MSMRILARNRSRSRCAGDKAEALEKAMAKLEPTAMSGFFVWTCSPGLLGRLSEET